MYCTDGAEMVDAAGMVASAVERMARKEMALGPRDMRAVWEWTKSRWQRWTWKLVYI